MGEKEKMKDLEKLNSQLNKLETKYMNDIAELEENSRKEDENIESLFAQAKMLGKNISKPERDVYYWKDTRSSAEVLEEKVYENSAKGELLQQIDETRDPSKRKELIEKLNNINDEQLKQEKKEEIRKDLESKKEERTKKFINKYRKLIEDKIKDNESKIAEIEIKSEEAVQEQDRTIRGFFKEDYNKNEVFKVYKGSKKITEYIKEVLQLKKEISLCKEKQRDLDKKYVQNDLMQEETIIDEKEEQTQEQAQEQVQEQKVAEPETEETKNSNEEKKENSEQWAGKDEKTTLVNEKLEKEEEEEKLIENEVIKAAEEEAKRIEEEIKAEEEKRIEAEKTKKENENVEIEYSAKDDIFLLTNMKNDKHYVSKISRTELEGIKDKVLKEILSDENKEKMADAMIVDKNIQMHYLLLTYYDKKYNTNKAEEYLQEASTIGKSKEQRQKDMDEISIKIKYNLKNFSKDVSKNDKKQIIKTAKEMNKTGIGEVKHGFLNSIKDKLSAIGGFMKRVGTNVIDIIGNEKLAELDEESTKESKPVVEHVDVDEKKAMEEADMKATENVKDTEKSQEM